MQLQKVLYTEVKGDLYCPKACLTHILEVVYFIMSFMYTTSEGVCITVKNKECVYIETSLCLLFFIVIGTDGQVFHRL